MSFKPVSGAVFLPTFVYTALSRSGSTVTSEAIATTAGVLREQLVGQGYLVQDIRQRRDARWLSRRVKAEDLAAFIQEFSALVRAGLTIPDSLAIAAVRPDCPPLAAVLTAVRDDVIKGVSLAEAFARYPEVFDRLFVATVKVGEKSGQLAAVFRRYLDFLRHRIALRRRLGQAMAYPVFLLIALAVILGVLFVFVLPRFVAMYADVGAALPWPTRVMMTLVEALPVALPFLAVIVGLAFAGWRRWSRAAIWQVRWDRFLDDLPYVGDIRRMALVAQLSRTLSTLLASGTSLIEALQTTAEALPRPGQRERLLAAGVKVSSGESLAAAMRAERLFPDAALRMVEVGESSGSLSEMLAEVASFQEELLDARLARVSVLIEPLLMLLMGLIVGGVIIVMYLPVFHMADVIR
jgi:type IV pilus assembly protein PilC